MKIIAIVEDEDCGPFAILDKDAISIVKCSDFYLAATISAYTGRPITLEITKECADRLVENGVHCLDFNEEKKTNNNIIDNKRSE